MNTSNTTNTTDNTIANPTTMTTADNEAQDSNLQQKEQLQLMIDGEKWDAIVQLLKWEEQKSQKQNTTAITTCSRIYDMLTLTSSNESSTMLEILKKRDDREAEALILMIITLGGRS